ncbi:UDP-N-acetylmuramate--L-alanine ligase [Atopobium fossor]|uniref:UDP-N-acetylmuramate--L-alanine ligase n=1 Tax=Atopobium fossor TaxID=39487 RepID=UPI0003FD6DF8|nr:UDP-N-acetylmuramate--L-alanine ligase [Atopobium fossor]
MSQTASTLPFSSAHFVGIGGAGMSGIALVLHQRGASVSGSDLKQSHYVRELVEAGIEVRVGHEAKNIDDLMPDVVVISSAIPETNPEVIRARELGIQIWPRAKMLAALGRGRTEIAVAGTHGKTTTSSMVSSMLDHMGKDPAFLIGGIVEEYGTNGRDGKGGYFVCEADESDGSFLYLDPSIAVITNIEADHLDHYGTIENVEKTFCQFMDLVGEAGCVVINGDDPHFVELARSVGRKFVTYGFKDSNDYVVAAGQRGAGITSNFTITTPAGTSVAVTLTANPGNHNMANATAALAVADILGFDVSEAAEALSHFGGAHRRFTHVGDVAGITVVDDYGHHPTEVAATLAAAKPLDFKRIIVCFQPHRYSRTQALADQFGVAFNDADLLFVTDVFSAGEMPIPGVSGKTISNAVKKLGTVSEVSFVPVHHGLIEKLCDVCQEGDLLITQGAGDVTLLGPQFIEAMQARLDGAVQ